MRRKTKRLATAFAAVAACAAVCFLVARGFNDKAEPEKKKKTKPPATQTTKSKPPTPLKRDNLIAKIAELSKTHQYIFLGDTDHRAAEIKELLADPEFIMKALADNGIEVVVLEGDIGINETFAKIGDGIKNGIVTRSFLIRTLQETGEDTRHGIAEIDALFYLNKMGMRLLYTDERYAKVKESPYARHYKYRNIVGGGQQPDEVYIRIFDDVFSKNEAVAKENPLIRKIYAAYCKIMLNPKENIRIALNTARLTGDSKTLIVYGMGHISEPADLDEMLGEDRCITIALFPTPESTFYISHPQDHSPSALKAHDLPEYYYDISTDEIVEVVGGTKSEQDYRSRLKYFSMTKEEYDAAVAKLPDKLKPYALPYTEYDGDLDNNQYSAEWWKAEDLGNEPN